ncbi:MAG: hypothetical protein KDB03_08880 [Planctomycetales bacterium]|nr:hypothetical protein [Planctomycetales bacterium]
MMSDTSTSSISEIPTVVGTTNQQLLGKVLLRSELGQIVQQWLVRSSKCTIGSARSCALRCELSGIAPYHALLVIGSKHALVRALAPKVSQDGLNANEILLNEGGGAFEIAGHRFEFFRHVEQSNSTTPIESLPISGRMKFTLARPHELVRRKSIIAPSHPGGQEEKAASSEETHALAQTKWISDVIRRAVEPLESQLLGILEPIAELQAEARKVKLSRRKRKARKGKRHSAQPATPNPHGLKLENAACEPQDPSSAQTGAEFREPTIGNPTQVSLSPAVEELLTQQSAAMDVLSERISDVNSQLLSIERIVADAQRPLVPSTQGELVAPNPLESDFAQNIAIEQLQTGIIAVSQALADLTSRQAHLSEQESIWRTGVQDQLSALHSAIETLVHVPDRTAAEIGITPEEYVPAVGFNSAVPPNADRSEWTSEQLAEYPEVESIPTSTADAAEFSQDYSHDNGEWNTDSFEEIDSDYRPEDYQSEQSNTGLNPEVLPEEYDQSLGQDQSYQFAGEDGATFSYDNDATNSQEAFDYHPAYENSEYGEEPQVDEYSAPPHFSETDEAFPEIEDQLPYQSSLDDWSAPAENSGNGPDSLAPTEGNIFDPEPDRYHVESNIWDRTNTEHELPFANTTSDEEDQFPTLGNFQDEAVSPPTYYGDAENDDSSDPDDNYNPKYPITNSPEIDDSGVNSATDMPLPSWWTDQNSAGDHDSRRSQNTQERDLVSRLRESQGEFSYGDYPEYDPANQVAEANEGSNPESSLTNIDEGTFSQVHERLQHLTGPPDAASPSEESTFVEQEAEQVILDARPYEDEDEPITEDSHEEDSVEDYMQRLLERMRGGDSTPLAKPSGGKSTPKPTVNTQPKDTVATTQPLPVETTEPFDPSKYLPRVTAPEKSQNLAAMRELANNSARTAIIKSARQRHVTTLFLKLAVAVIGAIVGSVLITINGFNLNIGLVATVASFLVALIWGFDALSNLKMIMQSLVLRPNENTPPPVNELDEGQDFDEESDGVE